MITPMIAPASFMRGILFSFCLAGIAHSAAADLPPANPMLFVTVNDTNNASDQDTGYGAVDTSYQIGKYDVTARQYCEFLNAVAADDPHQLYNEQMALDEKVACIQRSGSPGNYSYSIIADNKNRGAFPITYVNWYSAARFCNWMQNGCPQGPEGPKTTERGTYFWNSLNIITINKGATYFLPTENQWYKAAYYMRGIDLSGYYYYPTQSFFYPGNHVRSWPNQANCRIYELIYPWTQKTAEVSPPYLTPVGAFTASPGPYGTYDMGGNVFQWTSTSMNSKDQTLFVARGGSWRSSYSWIRNNGLEKMTREGFAAAIPSNTIGFRLVKGTQEE